MRDVHLTLCGLGLLMLCAAAVPGHAQEAFARDESVPTIEALSTPLRLSLPGPPALSYMSLEGAEEEGSDLSAEVARRWPRLAVSAALSHAAEAYAAATVAAGDTELPQHFIHFVLSWAGCLEYEATVVTVSTSEESSVDVMNQLARLVERAPDGPFTHVGLARVPLPSPPFRWRWAAVLSRRQLELAASLSRRQEPDTRLRVRFRPQPPLADPRIELVHSDGRSSTAPLRQEHDGWFDADIQFGPATGTVWLEVFARSPNGPLMVSHLPLEVGGAAAPAKAPVWQGFSRPDESFIDSTADAEALLTELLNAERQHYALPTLSIDEKLVAVARGHSTDMRGAGFFGHHSPTRGGLAERLHHAGYAAAAARENICRANSVYGAHISLLQSPTHRANLLASDVESVGVGIVIEHGVGAEPSYVVTQVFATPLRHPSPAQVAAAVAELVLEVRAETDAKLLRRLAELDASARALAHHVQSAGKLDQSRFQEEYAALQGRGFGIRALNAELLHTSTLDSLELPDLVRDDRFTHYGVGVARHIDEQQRAVFDIVILYAQVRAP